MSVAGTWKLEVNSPMGKQTPTLVINDDGSGEFQSPQGAAALSDGSIDGNDFSASVTLPIMGGIKAKVKGTVDGDSISGAVETPMGNSSFTGARG